MPKLVNATEHHICLPIMGQGSRTRVKQKAVDGVLVEEEIVEAYDKCTETLVLEPSLAAGEPGILEITKTKLKELEKLKAFESLTEGHNPKIRVM